MYSHATIQPKHLAAFVQALRQEERSSGTICSRQAYVYCRR